MFDVYVSAGVLGVHDVLFAPWVLVFVEVGFGPSDGFDAPSFQGGDENVVHAPEPSVAEVFPHGGEEAPEAAEEEGREVSPEDGPEDGS